MRRVLTGPMILNSDYVSATAIAAVTEGKADAIAFGRPFIANPDLPRRITQGLPFTPDVARRWYSQGPEGYVDYPAAA